MATKKATKNRGKGGPESLTERRNRIGGENLKQGTKAAQKACKADRTTERTLLRRMLTRLEERTTAGESDPIGSLLEKTLDSALAGDKDAMAFIGKYLLGNGKVSLDDLYNPSIIRKAK